jgi:hypothetical protein
MKSPRKAFVAHALNLPGTGRIFSDERSQSFAPEGRLSLAA